MTTPAQRKAFKTYGQKLTRVALSFRKDDPVLDKLQALADIHGSKKAAIVAAINNMEPKA